MRTQSNLASKMIVTANEIERILSLRRVYDVQKKRLEMAENALAELEHAIMAKINSGASIISSHEIQIKAIERRNVPWKSVTVELIGAEAADLHPLT